MTKCWRFWGSSPSESSANPTFEHYGCGNSASYQLIPGHGYNGAYLVIDGQIQNGTQYIYWGPPFANRGIETVEKITSKKGHSTGNCDDCICDDCPPPPNNPEPPPLTTYDCINGVCTPKTTYNTPGTYVTLSDCEVNCGSGCSGKCISNAEWATIEGLAGQLKNKNCG